MERLQDILLGLDKCVQCVICLDLLKNPVTTRCDHNFCSECIRHALKGKVEIPCPLCKKIIRQRSLKKAIHLHSIVAAVHAVTNKVRKQADIPGTLSQSTGESRRKASVDEGKCENGDTRCPIPLSTDLTATSRNASFDKRPLSFDEVPTVDADQLQRHLPTPQNELQTQPKATNLSEIQEKPKARIHFENSREPDPDFKLNSSAVTTSTFEIENGNPTLTVKADVHTRTNESISVILESGCREIRCEKAKGKVTVPAINGSAFISSNGPDASAEIEECAEEDPFMFPISQNPVTKKIVKTKKREKRPRRSNFGKGLKFTSKIGTKRKSGDVGSITTAKPKRRKKSEKFTADEKAKKEIEKTLAEVGDHHLVIENAKQQTETGVQPHTGKKNTGKKNHQMKTHEKEFEEKEKHAKRNQCVQKDSPHLARRLLSTSSSSTDSFKHRNRPKQLLATEPSNQQSVTDKVTNWLQSTRETVGDYGSYPPSQAAEKSDAPSEEDHLSHSQVSVEPVSDGVIILKRRRFASPVKLDPEIQESDRNQLWSRDSAVFGSKKPKYTYQSKTRKNFGLGTNKSSHMMPSLSDGCINVKNSSRNHKKVYHVEETAILDSIPKRKSQSAKKKESKTAEQNMFDVPGLSQGASPFSTPGTPVWNEANESKDGTATKCEGLAEVTAICNKERENMQCHIKAVEHVEEPPAALDEEKPYSPLPHTPKEDEVRPSPDSGRYKTKLPSLGESPSTLKENRLVLSTAKPEVELGLLDFSEANGMFEGPVQPDGCSFQSGKNTSKVLDTCRMVLEDIEKIADSQSARMLNRAKAKEDISTAVEKSRRIQRNNDAFMMKEMNEIRASDDDAEGTYENGTSENGDSIIPPSTSTNISVPAILYSCLNVRSTSERVTTDSEQIPPVEACIGRTEYRTPDTDEHKMKTQSRPGKQAKVKLIDSGSSHVQQARLTNKENDQLSNLSRASNAKNIGRSDSVSVGKSSMHSTTYLQKRTRSTHSDISEDKISCSSSSSDRRAKGERLKNGLKSKNKSKDDQASSNTTGSMHFLHKDSQSDHSKNSINEDISQNKNQIPTINLNTSACTTPDSYLHETSPCTSRGVRTPTKPSSKNITTPDCILASSSNVPKGSKAKKKQKQLMQKLGNKSLDFLEASTNPQNEFSDAILCDSSAQTSNSKPKTNSQSTNSVIQHIQDARAQAKTDCKNMTVNSWNVHEDVDKEMDISAQENQTTEMHDSDGKAISKIEMEIEMRKIRQLAVKKLAKITKDRQTRRKIPSGRRTKPRKNYVIERIFSQDDVEVLGECAADADDVVHCSWPMMTSRVPSRSTYSLTHTQPSELKHITNVSVHLSRVDDPGILNDALSSLRRGIGVIKCAEVKNSDVVTLTMKDDIISASPLLFETQKDEDPALGPGDMSSDRITSEKGNDGRHVSVDLKNMHDIEETDQVLPQENDYIADDIDFMQDETDDVICCSWNEDDVKGMKDVSCHEDMSSVDGEGPSSCDLKNKQKMMPEKEGKEESTVFMSENNLFNLLNQLTILDITSLSQQYPKSIGMITELLKLSAELKESIRSEILVNTKSDKPPTKGQLPDSDVDSLKDMVQSTTRPVKEQDWLEDAKSLHEDNEFSFQQSSNTSRRRNRRQRMSISADKVFPQKRDSGRTLDASNNNSICNHLTSQKRSQQVDVSSLSRSKNSRKSSSEKSIADHQEPTVQNLQCGLEDAPHGDNRSFYATNVDYLEASTDIPVPLMTKNEQNEADTNPVKEEQDEKIDEDELEFVDASDKMPNRDLELEEIDDVIQLTQIEKKFVDVSATLNTEPSDKLGATVDSWLKRLSDLNKKEGDKQKRKIGNVWLKPNSDESSSEKAPGAHEPDARSADETETMTEAMNEGSHMGMAYRSENTSEGSAGLSVVKESMQNEFSETGSPAYVSTPLSNKSTGTARGASNGGAPRKTRTLSWTPQHVPQCRGKEPLQFLSRPQIHRSPSFQHLATATETEQIAQLNAVPIVKLPLLTKAHRIIATGTGGTAVAKSSPQMQHVETDPQTVPCSGPDTLNTTPGVGQWLRDSNKTTRSPFLNLNETETQARLGLIATGLQEKELRYVRAFAKKYGGEFYLSFDRDKVTHVIVKASNQMSCDRTLKYLQGIAGKKWIVSLDWVIDSLTSRAKLAEDEYEVAGDNCMREFELNEKVVPLGPKQSRLSGADFKHLRNFLCICIPPYGLISIEQATGLLRMCGATVVDNFDLISNGAVGLEVKRLIIVDTEAAVERPDYSVLGEQFNAVVITIEWVYESISRFEAQPLDDFIVTGCTQGSEILPYST